MENGLLYILAFFAMGIALFAVVLPQETTHTFDDSTVNIVPYSGGYRASVGSATLSTSTNGTEIFEDAWTYLSSGGEIHFTGNIAIDVGLKFTLDAHTRGLIVTGEGESKSTITYTGTGYAINVTGSSTDQFDLNMQNFAVNGSTKTQGRHGIYISTVGRNTEMVNVRIMRFDYGLTIGTNAHCTVLNQPYVINCNYGIRLVNDSSVSPCNVQIWNPYIYNCNGSGVYIDSGAAHNYGLIAGEISTCGIGLEINGTNARNIEVQNIEFDLNNVTDIALNGGGDYLKCIKIKSCFFASQCPYAIKAYKVSNIQIDNPFSTGHTTAFLWYDNVNQNLLLNDMKGVEDTYLLDGSPDNEMARCAGSVIDARVMGVIVRGDGQYVKGDVVYLTGTLQYASWNPAHGQNNTGVVLYGNAAGSTKPMVIAVSGVAQVLCDGAVTRGDTLVVADGSSSYKKAETDNAIYDPKQIVGWAQVTDGDGGLVWCRIG